MVDPDVIRSEWTELRDHLDRLAVGMKNSQAAVVELSRRFGLLEPEARAVVEGVLADWIESDDSGMRFDAEAIVSDYRLTSALPPLRRLAAHLQTLEGPEPRDERETVLQTINELEKS